MPDNLMDHYTKVGIPCPKCRQHTEQTLAWLKTHNGLVCQSCDFIINLGSEENRTLIQNLDQVCAAYPIPGKPGQ
jgi:hypothetical protein